MKYEQPYLYDGLISGRKQLIRPKTIPKIEPDPTLTCDHIWKRYKKPVRPDNVSFQRFSAFFVVRACDKCKKVEYLDYHMS